MKAQRTRRRDRGASLVEFALLLPLLMLILLGTITGGLTLSRHNSVKNAVREATRFAAVLQPFDAATNTSDMYDQVVAGATGDLDPDADNREICVALIDNDGTWDFALYHDQASPTLTGTDAALAGVPAGCTDGFDATVAAAEKRVWIRAYRTSEVDAVLYSADWDLEARALTRYER